MPRHDVAACGFSLGPTRFFYTKEMGGEIIEKMNNKNLFLVENLGGDGKGGAFAGRGAMPPSCDPNRLRLPY